MLHEGTGPFAAGEEAWHATWPLVGRERELAAWSARLTSADRGGLVLAGPAGVGKSRLAVECGRIAEERGWRVARILATEPASTVPFGALAPLLPPLIGRLELRADLLTWAADAITAGEGRPVLLVDDAQLLDDATAIVVAQLVAGGRALVIATLRTGSRVPPPVHGLWKEGLVRRVDLGPLDDEQVDRLLGAVLGAGIDGATRRDLGAASAGNPLFLHELVVGAIDAGVLARVGDVWRLTRSLAVTPRLVELVDARVVDLDADEREAVELLAVGEPMELDTLSGLTRPDTLERLEHRQIIEVGRGRRRPEVRLAHPLYGEVVRDRMSALRAMAVNRRLADEAAGGEDLDFAEMLRVAVWRLDGGGDVDPVVMVAAARQAYFAHDDELAERLTRHAWVRGGGVPAGLLLAQVLGQLGRHEERHRLDIELAAAAGSDRERSMVAMDQAIGLWWGMRRGDEAIEVLRRCERSLGPGAWRDEVAAQRATFDLLAGRLTAAIESGASLLEHSDATRARVTAAVAVAPALAVSGRTDEALAVADAAFAAHLALGAEEVLADPGIHVVSRVLALVESGRLDEAAQTATVAYDVAIGLHNATGHAWFSLMLGRIALACGRLGDAAVRFREGANLFRALGQDGPLRWCLGGLVLAGAMRGDRAAAASARGELDAVAPQPIQLMEPDVSRARAWECLVRGDVEAAHGGLRQAAELADATAAFTLATHAWHDLVRLGRVDIAGQPLERLAVRVDCPLTAARIAHARALASGDADALAAAADGFEAVGALLLAAEAAAAAAAEAQRGARSRAADRLSERARSLAARCQGARTPALATMGAGRALTARERQVASLAADGLASKTIATRLGLSVRTVDNHLQHVYDKLGVADRLGLRQVLGAEPE